MNKKIKQIIPWVIAVLPIIITLLIFPQLPDKIPMHWNINGQVDRYDDKFPGAFITSGISIIILLLMTVLPKVDPRKENYAKFATSYYWLKLCFVILFSCLNMVTVFYSLGYTSIKVDMVVKFIVGFLILVLGNQLPKLKNNFFIGVRTPWTLSNEHVWFMTHRMAGTLWFMAGALMMVLAFIPGKISATLFFVTVMIAAFVPMLYSYWIFHRIDKS